MNTFLSAVVGFLLLIQTSGIGGNGGVGGVGGLGGGFTASGTGPVVVDFCTPSPTGTPTSINCTIPTSANTGDTIFVGTDWFDNHTITCSDSSNTAVLNVPASGTYPNSWHGGNRFYTSWTVKNVTAGSHTLTCSDAASPGTTPLMFAVLIRGASTSSPYDTGATLSVAAGAGPYPSSFPGGVFASTSITTTSASDLVLSVCLIGNNDPVTVVSPMTLITNGGGITNGLIGQTTAGAAGAITTSCTEPFSDDVLIDVSAYH